MQKKLIQNHMTEGIEKNRRLGELVMKLQAILGMECKLPDLSLEAMAQCQAARRAAAAATVLEPIKPPFCSGPSITFREPPSAMKGWSSEARQGMALPGRASSSSFSFSIPPGSADEALVNRDPLGYSDPQHSSCSCGGVNCCATCSQASLASHRDSSGTQLKPVSLLSVMIQQQQPVVIQPTDTKTPA